MKNIVIVLLFTLSSVNGQSVSSTHLYLKSGYFIPAKESFRENYDQNFFISDLNFPASLGFGLSILHPHHEGFFYNFEIQKIQNQLMSNKEIHFNQIPFSLGGKWFSKSNWINDVNFYAGTNFILCWSYFTGSYSITDDQGIEFGPREDVDHFFGYGIGINGGFLFDISDNKFIGLDLNYDFIQNGIAEEGGLGNIGGVHISISLGVSL
jgi:hypothetical protein